MDTDGAGWGFLRLCYYERVAITTVEKMLSIFIIAVNSM